VSNVDPDAFVLLHRSEELKVIEWLKSKKVQKLVKAGADFAIVFSRKSGIGITVTATVKAPDGTILSDDVTSYETW
jgi:hypothetical protein